MIRFNLLIFGISTVKGMAGTVRVQNFIDYLPKRERHDVANLIVANPNEQLDYPESGVVNNIEYKVLKYRLKNPLSVARYFITGFKYINTRRSKDKKNVFYVYGYPDISNIVFIYYAKRKGYKVVFDIVEDFRLIRDHKSILSKLKTRSAVSFLKRMLKRAEGCITISHHLYRYVSELPGIKAKVFLLPVSVITDRFIVSGQTSDHPGNMKIFYGGSFGPKDGLEVLFDAFDLLISRHYDLSLIITGKGENRLLENLISQEKYSRSKNRILRLGYLDKDRYYEVMNGADIFCMSRLDTPYANAGFPFKLGEMLATGKPVVSSIVGDVPLYLQDAVNAVLVEPGNASALAEAIEFLVLNPGKGTEIGRRGRQVAEEHFNAKTVGKAFSKALEAV